MWTSNGDLLYTVEPGRRSSGVDIGVLCQDCRVPFVPGDVQNASSFPFPVQYMSVPGATVRSVLYDQNPAITPAFVRAAQELEHQGVRAITGNCGYMLAYQREVAGAVSVPVLLSSLLQLPLLLAMLGPTLKVGVLVANGACVDEGMISQTGIRPEDRSRVVIRGLEDEPHFRAAILDEVGTLDRAAVAREVVQAATDLVERHPDIAALHLECSNLPPYSAEIQRATGRPVFDWIAFVEWVRRAVVPPTYPRPHPGFGG
jgi:hypothetical protein